MSINRSVDGHIIDVNQSGAINSLIQKPLTDSDTVCKTPQQEDNMFTISEADNELLDHEQSKVFLSVVMSLMYIARLTRPDILLPVAHLATRSHLSSKRDWQKLIRVLRYLKGNPTLGITIRCQDL